MANVAYMGTGLLGSGMVEAMLRRGDVVTVWNRTESKARALERLGAVVAASPAGAVTSAERVHMTLADDDAVEAVMAQLRPQLPAGAVVIDHSTTAPHRTAQRVSKMARDGLAYLHAPVFMSPQNARDGVGLMMVSGPEEIFERVRVALSKMTGEVWYLGSASGGLAASFKLFGNSMLFVIAAGLTDVFAMAQNLGIAPADALQVFSKFQLGGLIKLRGDKMVRRDFNATFELTMARKDMRLMLEAAGARPLAVLPSIAARMDKAIAEGHGRDDLGAIAAEVIR